MTEVAVVGWILGGTWDDDKKGFSVLGLSVLGFWLSMVILQVRAYSIS